MSEFKIDQVRVILDQSEACIVSIDQSQTWSDWSVARGTDIWLPGWPGLTPGWGMMTLCTPAPPTDTGGAATTKCGHVELYKQTERKMFRTQLTYKSTRSSLGFVADSL